jgi:hypothetical protein
MHVAEGAARPLLFSGIATQDVAMPFRAQDVLELTILMPCLNEAKTVVACVEAALGFLQCAGIRGEVLVADNGSTDGSRELAGAAGARAGGGSWLRCGLAGRNRSGTRHLCDHG